MSSGAKHKPIPREIREKVYMKYNGHCAYCGCQLSPRDMQVDHIIPKYREETQDINTDTLDNYMPACRMCNFYKSSCDIETFRTQLGKLLERLEKTFIYRLAKKYKLIYEYHRPITFFYEDWIKSHGGYQ